MSRLAKKTILLPTGVAVLNKNGDVLVKGPKGEELLKLLYGVELVVPTPQVPGYTIALHKGAEAHKQNVGTMWSLLRNAVEGVSAGFAKTLEIQGVGFKAAMDGKTLVLSLGFVNPVRFSAPPGVEVAVEKNLIKISGFDKQKVGQTASRIRLLKKPEPYKGKGIRYSGEVVRMKAGKKAAGATS